MGRLGQAIIGLALATGAATAPGLAATGRVTGDHTALLSPARFGATQSYDFDDHQGYVSLFDGKSLKGWDGDPGIWRVEAGTIVGARERGPAPNNSYLVFRGVSARNFDLKVEIRVIQGGSGIQYRSRTDAPWLAMVRGAPAPNLDWMMSGPQADLWAAGSIFNGQVYLENEPGGIVAWRGEVTEADGPRRPRQVGRVGDRIALGRYVDAGWNHYQIIARGGVVMHIVNGQLMAVHIDDDPASIDTRAGLIGFELEQAPARVEIRSVWLKKLK